MPQTNGWLKKVLADAKSAREALPDWAKSSSPGTNSNNGMPQATKASSMLTGCAGGIQTKLVEKTTKYVVGFNFVRPNVMSVVLILKNKPEWQAGQLNGVGGKVEPGESPTEAMVREYREETGDTFSPDWEPFLTLKCPGSKVFFFRAFSFYSSAHTTTKEDVVWIPLPIGLIREYPLLPNLRWIIPLALSRERGTFTYATN